MADSWPGRGAGNRIPHPAAANRGVPGAGSSRGAGPGVRDGTWLVSAAGGDPGVGTGGPCHVLRHWWHPGWDGGWERSGCGRLPHTAMAVLGGPERGWGATAPPELFSQDSRGWWHPAPAPHRVRGTATPDRVHGTWVRGRAPQPRTGDTPTPRDPPSLPRQQLGSRPTLCDPAALQQRPRWLRHRPHNSGCN